MPALKVRCSMLSFGHWLMSQFGQLPAGQSDTSTSSTSSLDKQMRLLKLDPLCRLNSK